MQFSRHGTESFVCRLSFKRWCHVYYFCVPSICCSRLFFSKYFNEYTQIPVICAQRIIVRINLFPVDYFQNTAHAPPEIKSEENPDETVEHAMEVNAHPKLIVQPLNEVKEEDKPN